MTSPEANLTQYLHRWRDGDVGARDALLVTVYDQLKRMARARMRGERDDHSLDTTALVHEAYLRLSEAGGTDWQDRAHFFAVASTAMRRVLIDHAKQRLTEKRGGGMVRVDFDNVQLRNASVVANDDPDILLALDAALARLEALHPRQAKALELRYYVGFTLGEAAEVLQISPPTVMRDLRFAEAWLAQELL